MSEDQKKNEGAIPPRFSLKQTGKVNEGATPATPSEQAKRQTTRVDISAAAQESPPTLKKKTARIPLEHVTAETGAAPGSPVPGLGVTSKTIRLSPAAPTPPSLSIPTPSPMPTSRVMAGGMSAEDVKRQTSRISLESVLGERPAGEIEVSGSTSAPKTIRIKRPTQNQTIKPLSGAPDVSAASSGPADGSAAKSTTARLELTDEAQQAEGQQTQRKTIKIRRAEGGAKVGPRSLSVARIEEAMASHEAEKMAEESVHVLFPIAAAVALLVLGFMVYILLAQAFPNPSLGYPGRITL